MHLLNVLAVLERHDNQTRDLNIIIVILIVIIVILVSNIMIKKDKIK